LELGWNVIFFGVFRSTYSWSIWEGFGGKSKKHFTTHINGKSTFLGGGAYPCPMINSLFFGALGRFKMVDSRLVAFDVGTFVAALGVNAALGQSRLGSFTEFRIATPGFVAPFCQETCVWTLSGLLLEQLGIGSIPGDIVGSAENKWN